MDLPLIFLILGTAFVAFFTVAGAAYVWQTFTGIVGPSDRVEPL